MADLGGDETGCGGRSAATPASTATISTPDRGSERVGAGAAGQKGPDHRHRHFGGILRDALLRQAVVAGG